MVEKKLLGDLKTMVATMLKFPSGRLDENADLGDLGVDSISMMRIMREISERFGVELSPARMVTADTLAQLSGLILTDHPEQLKRYYGAGSPPVVASKAEPPAVEPVQPVEPAPASPEERAWELALRRLSEKYDVDLSSALPRVGDAEAIVRVLSDRHRDQMVSYYGAQDRGAKDRRSAPTPEPGAGEVAAPARAARPAAGAEAIAIVGMSVRFPQAPDTRAFWRNLVEGRSAIGEVPASRWDWRRFYSEARTPGKTVSKWAALIDGPDQFDPLFFKISPREAALIDPQERLILQEGYRALEDAGLDVDALAGSKTAVFVGFEFTDYADHLHASGVGLGAAAPTYNLANRLSYCFDFRGPSEAINVNCASSAVAIHRAFYSLLNGESDLALAAGVCLHLLPQSQVAADDFLSPDGSCRVFDERANGFTRGEGCGVVVLKRLADAQRDGDRIYALIKASAQNNRGRAKSMSDIRGEALTEVIRTCLERAQVEPESLRYVEVDGYCTKWGDAIEYDAIKRVFSGVDRAGSPGKTCGLGSLKGNVGHLEPASGIAGVIKLALALWHRRFPPTVTFEQVNEYLDVEKQTHPLYLMDKARSFDDLEGPAGRPVRAGVNSFADSGVNVHILLEEPPRPEAAGTSDAGPCLVVLSAQTRERLETSVARLLAFLRETPPDEPRLGDLAYSLQVGRRAMAARLALVVADRSALIEGLQSFLAPSAEAPSAAALYVGPEERESAVLSRLLAGETGEQLISLLIAEGRLERLALLWSQGVSIPWARLYTDKKYAGKEYRKISLPGYPFEERRCWFGQAAAEPEPVPGAPTPPTNGGLRGLLTHLVVKTLDIPVEQVAPDVPLQNLGLHSLAQVEVVRALEEQLGISLSHREVLEHTTIAALTQLLESKLGREAVEPPAPRLRASAGWYPLSEGQKGLWLLQAIEPGMSAYNLPVALRIEAEVDRAALRRAFAAVFDRHPALRSVVRRDPEGIPWQSVDEALEMPWTETSIASFADGEVRSLLEAAFKEPFATEGGLFVRAHLFSRSATSHVLLFTVHHLLFDGTSAVRFVDDLLAAYNALARGEDWQPAHGEGAASYRDFVEWEQRMLEGPAGRAHLAYWKTQLAGELPKLEWLTDKPRPAQQTSRGATVAARLTPEQTSALRKLAHEQGVSLFVLLLGLYKVLLHRYTGQQDLVVGVPSAGRPEQRFAHTVGYFVDVIALRSSVTGGRAFSDYLDALKWTVADGLDHAAYPFPRLVRELEIPRDASRSPVFQTIFVLQSFVARDAERALAERFPGFSILEDLHTAGGIDVRLEVVEKEQHLALNVSYDPELFVEDTLRRLTAHYATLAESAIGNPSCPIAELDLLSDAERRMIAGWNDTRRDDLSGGSLSGTIAAQAESRPDAVASRCGDRVLTYGELCRQTGRLARVLRGLGVGPDVLVGVSMGRSLEMVLGMLGVLEAGGAYVLLDPDLPDERLSFLIEDTRLGIVLTCSARAERLGRCLGASTRSIVLDGPWAAGGEAEADLPAPRVAPEHLAYVAFTSGSTGVPKGVMVEHGNLLNYTLALLDRIDFGAIETVAHVSTFYADLGYTVLYPGLAAGKTVCIAEEECRWDGARFGRFLADHAVECLKMTPSHFFSLTRGLPPPRQLKILILGGESMSAAEVERVFEELPETRLYNHYGPTETTVGATVWELSERTWDRRNRIGKPLANVSVHVLDERLEPVPVGVAGELCIGGRGVARGYLDRPAQTAEAFVELSGQRLYRTGDRARWLPDGSLEYLGRRDLQVKIRGYRVEPGEVESVLAAHPEVCAAAIVAKQRQGTQQLVAYYATEGGSRLDAALRKTLEERLPSYMVPAVFVELEALPLDANGKVDRRRLAEQEVVSAPRGALAAPQSAIEKKLALLWQELLQVEQVGRHDNFFALGGDSMIAIRFFTKARERGLRMQASDDIFRYQTLAELAARCEHDETAVWFAELVRLNRVETGQPVFWLHGGMGGVEAYGAIAERVGRPFYGIQARGFLSAEEPLVGIETMAAHYVHILRSVQPEGAYDLGGYSFGGILAYEITRQLQEQGRTVASVVLIDSSDVESLKRRERAGSSRRESYLQAVNTALLSLAHRRGDALKILIHRDELDADQDEETFLNRLFTLATVRGLKKTRRQIRAQVEAGERIQQGYELESFSLRPLPRPEDVRGYYLRNSSGAFLGAFEPYFALSRGPAPVSPESYWRGWEEHFPNLEIQDVESSSHVTMLSEAASREHILSFCAALYDGAASAPAERLQPVGAFGG